MTALASLAAAPAAAQTPPSPSNPIRLPEVVVTGNPLGTDSFSLVPPVSVLGGAALLQRRRSTLGETLDGLPGVSSTYFGPNASRPVIRGLDGDRVRILQNGTGVLDASAASVDHAVAIDPLSIDRAEVVRGPSALLYGGNAVGGVVNVLNGRIPQSPIDGYTGRIEGRVTAGGDREKSGAALFEAGNGRFALHADAYKRDTDDLKIPGFARSQRLRASGSTFGLQPDGVEADRTVPNSAARSDGGALGGSITWDSGHAGLSYSGFNANYGTVAEPTVTIDMKSQRWDFAGETKMAGRAIEAVRFRLGHTDYEHREIDAGVVGTTFSSRGYDARLEAVHGRLGPLTGAFGVQLTDFDFSALGAEAFVPRTRTDAKALFVYEELPLDRLKLSLGARAERTSVRSEGGGPVDASTGLPRFDPPQERAFSAGSGAFGVLYSLSDSVAIVSNLAYTERAPTFQELYANGPHAATGAYEVGSPAFGKEKSKAIDLALRTRSGPHSGSVGVFYNRFDRFLSLAPTANTRGADGELNPEDADGDGIADGSGEEVLPEYVYRAVPARFRGMEMQGMFRVYEARSTLDLDLKADFVRASDRSTGAPLPRIAPLRLGAGLTWNRDGLGARMEVVYAEAQDRVAPNELPTDSYTLVNAAFTYRFKAQASSWEAYLRANNLFDREARNHVSFLKDIVPLAGRSVTAGLRGTF